MDRAFQFALRVALVLCILAGVGMIVYQIVGPGPIHRRVANQPVEAVPTAPPTPQPVVPPVAPPVTPTPVTPPAVAPPVAQPPAAQAAAAQPSAPGVPPEAPAGTPAATSPTPAPTPAPEATAAPAATGATPPAATAKAGELSISGWMHKFLSRQDPTRAEGEVSGTQAVIKSDSAVDILAPILLAYALEAKGQPGVDVATGAVRVTAKNGNVDKDKGLVRLFGDVKAEGKDFVVRADHVLYSFTDRILTTDSHVDMERDNVAADGTKTPAMSLAGDGLDVDMNLQTMKVQSGVVCRIFKVTPDFLAGSQQAEPASEQPMDVTITCDGPMVYQNSAHRVTFTKNAKAVYGAKTMTCDELTVQLAAAEGARGADKTTVNDMFAAGNVTLSFENQVAHGQNFDWHTVTGSGTLVGEPCDVTTPQFRIVGKTLDLYRTDSRFDAKGPGQLIWGGKPQPAAVDSAATPAAAPAAAPAPTAASTTPPQTANSAAAAAATTSPFSLNKDQPVTIDWKTSMSYVQRPMSNEPPHAVFVGGVVAQQKDSTLTCDKLELNLRADGGDIDTTVATGNVDVRDLSLPNGGRDILCQELVWKAQEDTVELTAAKGQTVTITQGPQTIASAHVLFDNAKSTLECPAPGHLTIAAAQPPAGADAGAPPEPALPTSVDWQTAMRFEQHPKAVATFTGNAVAQRGDQSMKADTLQLDFDPNMKPLKITAQGGAVLDVSSAQGLPLGALGAPAAPAAQPAPAGQPAAAAPPAAPAPMAAPAQPAAAQPGAAQPAPAAQPPAAAQPAAPAAPTRWRLTGESLVIEPPLQVIWSDVPGTLTVLGTAAQTGTVAWQKQMRLESPQAPGQNPTAHFVGGVTSEMNGGTLKCDDLKATFDDQRRLHDAHCEGNVEFDATGENPWKMKSATADAIFVNGALHQVIAWGDAAHKVEVADQARTLLSRRLTLFLEPLPDGSSPGITRATAEEDVSVTYNQDPPILATGDKLLWDRVSDNYTLTGEPRARLIRGGIPTSGPTIIIRRPTGATPGVPAP